MRLVALGNKRTVATMLSELPAQYQTETGSVQKKKKKGRVGTTKMYGGSDVLGWRKGSTGAHGLAHQMLKHPQCLLRTSGSVLAGERHSLEHVTNCCLASQGSYFFHKLDLLSLSCKPSKCNFFYVIFWGSQSCPAVLNRET